MEVSPSVHFFSRVRALMQSSSCLCTRRDTCALRSINGLNLASSCYITPSHCQLLHLKTAVWCVYLAIKSLTFSHISASLYNSGKQQPTARCTVFQTPSDDVQRLVTVPTSASQWAIMTHLSLTQIHHMFSITYTLFIKPVSFLQVSRTKPYIHYCGVWCVCVCVCECVCVCGVGVCGCVCVCGVCLCGVCFVVCFVVCVCGVVCVCVVC